MTSLTRLSLSLVVAASAVSVAEPVRSERRPVADFHAVRLAGGLKATIKKGEAASVTLVGEASLLEAYRTEVVDGVLVIERKRGAGWTGRGRPVAAMITTPALDGLEASGGVEAVVQGTITGTLAVSASGGVSVTAPGLSVSRLVLDASGGAELRLAGTADRVKADFSGGVEADLSRLTARTMELDASGGCTVDARVTDEVGGDLSGGVGLTLHGRPQRVTVEKSGGVSISYTST